MIAASDVAVVLSALGECKSFWPGGLIGRTLNLLAKYGGHTPDCAGISMTLSNPPTEFCDCGWSEVESALTSGLEALGKWKP